MYILLGVVLAVLLALAILIAMTGAAILMEMIFYRKE